MCVPAINRHFHLSLLHSVFSHHCWIPPWHPTHRPLPPLGAPAAEHSRNIVWGRLSRGLGHTSPHCSRHCHTDTPFLSRDSSPSAQTHATPQCFNALSLLLAHCIASLPPLVHDCLFCQSGPASKRQAGQVPIICAPRGNVAEMIAKKVEMKIWDSIITASHSQGSSSLFSQEPSGLSTLQ